MKKIKSVKLLKCIQHPAYGLIETGTVGIQSAGCRSLWAFSNQKNKTKYFNEGDLLEYPEWFEIEYEQPKIKSVKMVLNGVYDEDYNGWNFYNFYTGDTSRSLESCSNSYIRKHPKEFIIEYEEDK